MTPVNGGGGGGGREFYRLAERKINLKHFFFETAAFGDILCLSSETLLEVSENFLSLVSRTTYRLPIIYH